jgi:uncharacterized protein (DUF58 family)
VKAGYGAPVTISVRRPAPARPIRTERAGARPTLSTGPQQGSRQRPTRRYHFHGPGVIYVIVTMFIAVGAINSQNNLLFCALGLAIGGLLVSGVVSGGALMGLRLHRSVPGHVSLGEPLRIEYRIRNGNRIMPAFGIHIQELASHTADASAANWPSFFMPPRAFMVQVAPRSAGNAAVEVVPRRRGVLVVGSLIAWTTFPFGLVKKSIELSVPHSTVVHPPILPLRPGVLRQLTARSPFGMNSDRAPGMGDDFFGLREYIAGDNPRRIAWKRSARTGELIVRQNATPAPQRIWVVLRLAPADRDVPGGVQRLNERAIALAASLLHAASEGGIAVGLAIPGLAGAGALEGASCALVPPRLGRAHHDRLLGELAVLDARGVVAAPIPEAAARSGACAVIEAVPGSPAPPHALRISAAEAERFLADTDAARRALALFDPPLAPAGERRRWVAGLRALVRAAGGSA